MRRRRDLLPLPPKLLLRPDLPQRLILRAAHPRLAMREARRPPVMRVAPPRRATPAGPPPAIRTAEQPRRLPAMALRPPIAGPRLPIPEGAPLPIQQGAEAEPVERPAEERAGPVPMRAGEREVAILHQQEAMRLAPPTAARCAPAPTASGAMSTTRSAEWIFIMGWPAAGGFL